MKLLQLKEGLKNRGEASSYSLRVIDQLDLLDKSVPFEVVVVHEEMKSVNTALRYFRTWGDSD